MSVIERCIVLGGVALVMGRARQAGIAVGEISDELNLLLVEDKFLQNAPFQLLNGIVLFGHKFDPFAKPLKIKKNQLEFSVEVEMALLHNVSKEAAKPVFAKALLPALFAISDKYALPTKGLSKYAELYPAS